MLTGRMLPTVTSASELLASVRLEDEKRQPWKEHQAVNRPGVAIDLDRFAVPHVG